MGPDTHTLKVGLSKYNIHIHTHSCICFTKTEIKLYTCHSFKSCSLKAKNNFALILFLLNFCVFFSWCHFSGAIWSGAETWKGSHIGRHATVNTKSRPTESLVRRTGWPAALIVSRFESSFGNLWIYKRKGGSHAPKGAWMPLLLNAYTIGK